MEYNDRERLVTALSRSISEEIMKQKGKEIVSQVLTEVNWPEIVRSKVAAKTIKEIVNSVDLESRHY